MHKLTATVLLFADYYSVYRMALSRARICLTILLALYLTIVLSDTNGKGKSAKKGNILIYSFVVFQYVLLQKNLL